MPVIGVWASDDLPCDRISEKTLLTIPAGTVLPGRPEFRFRSWVFASIDWTKDGVLISSCLFDEDGYGRTYDEAWSDFITSLRDKLASLEKRVATLSIPDREILRHLRESIIAA